MRRAITTLAAAALVMMAASTALAGGWAVTSVDSMPDEFEAETTYTIEYTIRAHGKTPADAGASFLMFRNFDADKSLRFDAANHGDGTYSVQVTLPDDGTWEWEATNEFYGTQEMGAIEVAPAGVATSGFDLVDALKVLLPLATLAAAAFTWREWSRARAGEPTTETG